MQHVCESASQRQHQLLEERRTGEAQLQSALLELRQKTQELNQTQSNILQLKEERATLQEEVRHIFPPRPLTGGSFRRVIDTYCKWAIACQCRNGFNRLHLYNF